MWICEKCGREFKKEGQDHFCGEPPKTIDEYIERQDHHQERLREIRQVLRESLPDAEEKISWSMPTYRKTHNIVHFALFRQHIGFYPGPDAVAFFEDRLSEYKHSKGSIQFPHKKELPLELIREIALWCRETGHHA